MPTEARITVSDGSLNPREEGETRRKKKFDQKCVTEAREHDVASETEGSGGQRWERKSENLVRSPRWISLTVDDLPWNDEKKIISSAPVKGEGDLFHNGSPYRQNGNEYKLKFNDGI